MEACISLCLEKYNSSLATNATGSIDLSSHLSVLAA